MGELQGDPPEIRVPGGLPSTCTVGCEEQLKRWVTVLSAAWQSGNRPSLRSDSKSGAVSNNRSGAGRGHIYRTEATQRLGPLAGGQSTVPLWVPETISSIIRPCMSRLAKGYVLSSRTPPKMTGGALG